ncbi:MAG: TetR/AcrR family transcriptional regulator [Pseudomonadota bacterium]|uniref:TetR/AcrR family transcriptional regulator n=1 Tax=Roseovarius TaxID=74030 RepID=UPI0022A82608|nr:TetR/AcrR family transcriptional regulator [Roseovarius sp. EGI FJ00037]MCZ0814098.1 TetR/AcrR family transcriptional regulator [Roseovarius sp. EGI FJ00037]
MMTTSRRLAQDDWLLAGQEALARSGPASLKAEPLARRLKTTKGSFYWHFADVPAFHAALLARWEDESTARLDAAHARESHPVGQLRHIAQIIGGRDADDEDRETAIEPAIRAWAKDNAEARLAVTRVDQYRLALMQRLLAEIGIANPEMARIIYACAIGMEELAEDRPGGNAQAMGSLVDLVLALR